jgi:uncharacterized secreted protein with C-terminal beta-propeller domain
MNKRVPLLGGLTLILLLLGMAVDLPAQVRTSRSTRRTVGRIVPETSARSVSLKSFGSCGELHSYMTEVIVETLVKHKYWLVIRPWMGPEDGTGASERPNDYTTTNVQEKGVDEVDIVKTDGEYLYVADNDLFAVVQSWPPERSALTASLRLEGWAHGLFLHRRLAVVFSNYYDDSGFAPEGPLMPEYDRPERSNPAQGRANRGCGGSVRGRSSY